MMDQDMTQDDCEEQAHSGGITSPYCLEAHVFKDWLKEDMDELLVADPEPEDRTHTVPKAKATTGNVAVVVHGSGETFAETISSDLAGLEEQFSRLAVVSSAGLAATYDMEKQ